MRKSKRKVDVIENTQNAEILAEDENKIKNNNKQPQKECNTKLESNRDNDKAISINGNEKNIKELDNQSTQKKDVERVNPNGDIKRTGEETENGKNNTDLSNKQRIEKIGWYKSDTKIMNVDENNGVKSANGKSIEFIELDEQFPEKAYADYTNHIYNAVKNNHWGRGKLVYFDFGLQALFHLGVLYKLSQLYSNLEKDDKFMTYFFKDIKIPIPSYFVILLEKIGKLGDSIYKIKYIKHLIHKEAVRILSLCAHFSNKFDIKIDANDIGMVRLIDLNSLIFINSDSVMFLRDSAKKVFRELIQQPFLTDRFRLPPRVLPANIEFTGDLNQDQESVCFWLKIVYPKYDNIESLIANAILSVASIEWIYNKQRKMKSFFPDLPPWIGEYTVDKLLKIAGFQVISSDFKFEAGDHLISLSLPIKLCIKHLSSKYATLISQFLKTTIIPLPKDSINTQLLNIINDKNESHAINVSIKKNTTPHCIEDFESKDSKRKKLN